MSHLTKRLLPEQDLRGEMERIAQENEIKAGVVISAVGCVRTLSLRLADGKTVRTWEQPFEIVSMTGTVSLAGCHLHLSAADTSGAVIGGHLKESSLVGTTVELVILVFDDVDYLRVLDSETGYNELVVKNL